MSAVSERASSDWLAGLCVPQAKVLAEGVVEARRALRADGGVRAVAEAAAAVAAEAGAHSAGRAGEGRGDAPAVRTGRLKGARWMRCRPVGWLLARPSGDGASSQPVRLTARHSGLLCLLSLQRGKRCARRKSC